MFAVRVAKSQTKPRSARQLFINSKRYKVDKIMKQDEVKRFLKECAEKFDGYHENSDEYRYWNQMAHRDIERYNEEIATINDHVYFMRKYNLPCFCRPCISYCEPANCKSPFMAYMRPTIVAMKKKVAPTPDNDAPSPERVVDQWDDWVDNDDGDFY